MKTLIALCFIAISAIGDTITLTGTPVSFTEASSGNIRVPSFPKNLGVFQESSVVVLIQGGISSSDGYSDVTIEFGYEGSVVGISGIGSSLSPFAINGNIGLAIDPSLKSFRRIQFVSSSNDVVSGTLTPTVTYTYSPTVLLRTR